MAYLRSAKHVLTVLTVLACLLASASLAAEPLRVCARPGAGDCLSMTDYNVRQLAAALGAGG